MFYNLGGRLQGRMLLDTCPFDPNW